MKLRTIFLAVAVAATAITLSACAAVNTPTASEPIVTVTGCGGVTCQPDTSSTDEDCADTIDADVTEDGRLVVSENFTEDDCFVFPDGSVKPAVPSGSLSTEDLLAYNRSVVDPSYFEVSTPENDKTTGTEIVEVNGSAGLVPPTAGTVIVKVEGESGLKPSAASPEVVTAPGSGSTPVAKTKAPVKAPASPKPVKPSTPKPPVADPDEVVVVEEFTEPETVVTVVETQGETVVEYPPAPVVPDAPETSIEARGEIGDAVSGRVVYQCFYNLRLVATVEDISGCSAAFAAEPPTYVESGMGQLGAATAIQKMYEHYVNGELVETVPAP